MFCSKCGAQLIENSLFCQKCGLKIINGHADNKSYKKTGVNYQLIQHIRVVVADEPDAVRDHPADGYVFHKRSFIPP